MVGVYVLTDDTISCHYKYVSAISCLIMMNTSIETWKILRQYSKLGLKPSGEDHRNFVS